MPTEQLRAKYLDIAGELVSEAMADRPALSHVVSRVGLAEVARSVGASRTSVSRLWNGSDAFWDDLAAYISGTELGPTFDETQQFFAGASSDLATVLDYTRRTLNATQQAMVDDPWLIVRAALLGHPGTGRLSPLVTRSANIAVRAIASQWSLVLPLLELVPLEPLTVDDLAIALYCVADGLAVAGHLTPVVAGAAIDLGADPATIRAEDGVDGRWGLLAYAARCMFIHCTRTRRTTDAAFPPLDPPSPIAHPDTVVPEELGAHAGRWSPQQRAALEAAKQLFVSRIASTPPPGTEAPITGPLARLTVSNLASRAGVSRQAVYKLWPTQSELRIDFIRSRYRDRYTRSLDAAERAIEAAVHDQGDPMIALFDSMVTWLRESRPTATLSYLAFAADFNDWRVKQVGREATEGALDRYATQLAAMLSSTGRGLKPYIRGFDLAALTALTAFGASRLAQSNPDLLARRSDAPAPWSPLAHVMHSFVIESTVNSAAG